MGAGRDNRTLVSIVKRKWLDARRHVVNCHRGADHADRTVVVLHGQGYREYPVITVRVCDRIGYIHGVNVRAGMRVRPHAVIVVGRYRVVRTVSPIPGEGQIIAAWIRGMAAGRDNRTLVGGVAR